MAKQKRTIDEVFPILAVEDGILISKNGDMTVSYELTMKEIFTISSGDYDRMHAVFSRALQSVDTNMVILKQDWYMVEKYAANYGLYAESPVTLGRSDERSFAERPYLNHRCLLFITRPMDVLTKKKSSQSSLLSPRLIPRKITDSAYLSQLLEVAEQFVRTLEESKLFSARRLSEEELDYQLTPESIFQKYFSLSDRDLSLTDMEMSGEFKINGKFCGVTAVGELDEFPVQLASSAPMEKYGMGKHILPGSLGFKVGLSLPFNHIYNQLFYVDNSQKLIKELEASAKRMTSFSLQSRQNLINVGLKEAFIQKAVETGSKVIRMHANVLTWHEDRETMLTQRSKVTAGFSSMGFTPRQAISDAPVLYWSCIPGNAAEIGADNLAMCFAEEAACILALENNYQDKIHGKLGIKLTDRVSGCPKMVDIFIEPRNQGIIDNRNALLVGPSGSGKSFLMNLLQYHLLEQETDIIIVDTGHSYKRLCEQMGGIYVSFDKDSPLAFNPFYFDPAKMTLEEVAESKQNVIALLLALWKSEAEPVSKSEEVGIENLINEFYLYVESSKTYLYPCFNSFFDFFNQVYLPSVKETIREKDIDLLNFKFVMNRFYGDNYLGYLLNAPIDNPINKLLEERFVVFEMDNIKDNPTLHTVTTIAIMTLYVRKLMRKNEKAIFSMLIIEEAWRLVGDPRFAKFLKWVAKTARKHFGSLVSVTQEPGDLMSPLVKEAIIKNSAIKILLDFSQYKNQSAQVQEILGLSDEETALLMSVNQGRDPSRKYKEVFISWNGLAKVYGVEVGRESYATYTTEKSEVAIIESLKKKHGSYDRAALGFARGEHLYQKVAG